MYQITLSAPGKNAMSTVLMQNLLQELKRAEGQAVLLTGAGDAFSAGLNLNEIAGLDTAGLHAFLKLLEETCEALYTYPGPTVAHINGHAIAGGCVLALCCDLRVMTASSRARIGLNEVALGLRFPPVTFAIVSQALAEPHRSRVLLDAGLYDPETALKLGLVHEVAEDSATRAAALIARLESHSLAAYAETKQSLRQLPNVRKNLEALIPSWTSGDVVQRLLSALQKR